MLPHTLKHQAALEILENVAELARISTDKRVIAACEVLRLEAERVANEPAPVHMEIDE